MAEQLEMFPEMVENKVFTKVHLQMYHEQMCYRMMEMVKRKNADYTADSEDPFSNFTSIEKQDVCSTETGFLVRLNDKFSRIKSFVKQGVLKVSDESVEDTLIDMANYCILMAAYIRSKKISE